MITNGNDHVDHLIRQFINLNFFAHFAAFSSRTLRLESFDLGLEEEPLTAKFAKERPQSTQRNSNRGATSDSGAQLEAISSWPGAY
jgi:hypothetical protein